MSSGTLYCYSLDLFFHKYIYVQPFGLNTGEICSVIPDIHLFIRNEGQVRIRDFIETAQSLYDFYVLCKFAYI